MNFNIDAILGECPGVLSDIPSGSFDLVITSPPYNIGKPYETSCSLTDYLDDMKVTISELHRVLRPTGAICWQVGNYVYKGEVFPLDIPFYEMFKGLGMKLRNRIVWKFGHGLHCKYRLSGRYETLLWFTKGDTYTFNLDSIRIPSKYPGKKYYKGPKKGQFSGNPLGKNPSDVWEFLANEWEGAVWDIPNVKHNHPEKTEHPCQFPIELAERCVLAFSNMGDVVLDPFAGVGSTLLAAIKNNRNAVGYEKEEGFIKIAKQRIVDFFDGHLPYRPIGKPIHAT